MIVNYFFLQKDPRRCTHIQDDCEGCNKFIENKEGCTIVTFDCGVLNEKFLYTEWFIIKSWPLETLKFYLTFEFCIKS